VLLGVVVKDGRSVCVEATRGEGVLKANTRLKFWQGSPDVLHRDPGTPERSDHHALDQPHEGDPRISRARGQGMMSG
jgi:hypothetical protein